MTVAEELQIAVEVTGAQNAAAALEKVDKAVIDMAENSLRASKATAQAGNSFIKTGAAGKAQAYAMAGQVNTAAELIYNFSILSPATRQFGTAMVMAGGSAFAFAGALGPIGVIGGTLVGIIPGLISLFQETGDELDEVSGAAGQAASVLSDLEQSAVDAAHGIEEALQQIQRAADAQDQLNRLMAGGGTRDEQEAYLRTMTRAHDEASSRMEAWVRDLGLSSTETSLVLQRLRRGSADFNQALISDLDSDQQAQLRRWADTFAYLDREIAKRQALVGSGSTNDSVAALNAAAEEERKKREREARARRGRSSRDREPSLDDLMSRARTSPTDRLISGLAGQADFSDTGEVIVQSLLPATKAIDEAQEALFRLQDRMNAAAEEIPGLSAEFNNSWRGDIESVRDAYQDLIDKQIEAGQVTTEQGELMRITAKSVANQMVESIGGDMRSAFDSSMDAILDGTKSGAEAFEAFAKNIIKSLVKRSIVEVVVNAAEAIAAAARYDYAAAAQHAAAAAMWGAVGGVAAGVGFGTGLLGGGGAPASDPNAGVNSLPEDTGDGERGGGTTVINVGTFPVSTEAEIGRAIQDALDARQRAGI